MDHCGSLWITVETVSHAVCDDVDLDDLDDSVTVTLELIGSGNSLLKSLKRFFRSVK